MIMYIILSSLFLENILSNHIPLNSMFTPLFTVVSLVLIYPYFVNDDDKFLKYCAITGLIYDLIFTNTVPLNLISFLLVGLIIKLINITLSNNFINVMIIAACSVIMYLIITYFLLVIIGYKTFNFNYLITSIYQTLFANIIYSFIGYIISDKISKKYQILKID